MTTDVACPERAFGESAAVYAIAVAAFTLGIYARFKGLGAAPLAIDEYYLVRSANNVLERGWPQFDCGGLYTRALILQYAMAPLLAAGMSVETAPRLFAVLGSVMALPAVYLLGSRVRGRTGGLLAMAIVALSVWEVELARFGRMYAPFQAVFLWYLVFFLQYAVDRKARALWPMLALTVLATLIWEGGVLLALANLLPVFLTWTEPARWTRREIAYLALSVTVLAATYVFVTVDLRLTEEPAWPAGYESMAPARETDVLLIFADPLRSLPSHPVWMSMLALPIAASALAFRWMWRLSGPGLATAGLAAAVVAALLHQFAGALSIVTIVLLFRLVTWKQLLGRHAWPFHVAIGSCVAFWVAFTLATVDWNSVPGGFTPRNALALAHQFVGFPDVADVVIRPWQDAIPLLGTGLFLLLCAAVIRAIVAKEPDLTAERALLIVLVCLLLAVGASDPPRHETRYVFFLYPLAIIIAIGTMARGLQYIPSLRRGLHATALAALLLGAFALSEDFRPRHLLRIDQPAVIFRAGLSDAEASHLVTRTDSREIAQWLRTHATQPGDLVISGYHSLEYYFPDIGYFFTDWRDRNFPELSCQGGQRDRWSNRPLLYTAAGLKETIGTRHRAFVVMFTNRIDRLVPEVADWRPEVVLSTQNVSIVRLRKQTDARVMP